MQASLHLRSITGAYIAGNNRRRADIDREAARERNPEQQSGDTDSRDAVGADVVADERGVNGAEHGD